ncbi:hypothetical protein F9C11_21915 [Amycolatopsis sp. VS8301801F10]|uniref:hypothetical protein n=1 Tax=Amycolatopsis sp. VS8301801F10 TaxID=2652442 RepID=UPI0038FC72D9
MDLSGGCPRCYSQQDLAILSGDAGSVPDRLVVSIASEAGDHWSGEQWRFLGRRLAPRLISLVRARAVDPGLAPRVFGPDYADLAGWPDAERRATEEALAAALADALEHWPSRALVALLGGLACGYDDLRPWLARIDPATGPAALGGVVRLACCWAADLLWGEDDWFAWWHTDDPSAPVREWTLSEKTRTAVARFSQAHPTCKTARDALLAYDRLDRGEDSPWWYPGYGWNQWRSRGLPGHYGWLRPRDTRPA